MFLGLGL